MGSGYKERTMRKLMDDTDTSRAVETKDLILIAHHTNVPVEFFTTPDPWSGWKHQPSDPRVERVARLVEMNNAILRAGIGMLSAGKPVPEDITDWGADVAAAGEAIAEAENSAQER